MLNESDIESLQSSIQSFFEGNYNETWNATLNQFDALVANLSLYISCFEFNKFWGMPNELELEKLGIQLVERKQLWAALVFTNFPSNQKACGPCPDFFCKFQDAKIWILNILRQNKLAFETLKGWKYELWYTYLSMFLKRIFEFWNL